MMSIKRLKHLFIDIACFRFLGDEPGGSFHGYTDYLT